MYYSWKCDDLGGATLYAAERMPNPDAPSYSWPQRCSMIDRAQPFDIVGHFWNNIMDALNNQLDYNTGIIKICRMLINGSTSNFYLQWHALVSGTNQTVTIRFGYGDGSDWTSTPGSRTYTYDTFLNMPVAERCIYVIYNKGREHYSEAESPGWNGWTMLILVCGQVSKQIGTYIEPSLPSYPYGRMSYTTSSYGSISDIPGGTVMCYSDNAESRANQSELVAYLVGPDSTAVSVDFNTEATVIPCAYDGSYDQDPGAPDPNQNEPSGPSKPGGGDGDHRHVYDPIPIPGLPDIGPNSAGFVYMLRLTVDQMAQFAVDLLKPSWWQAIKNFFADPLDFICGIMIVPYQPVSQWSVYPKFGEEVYDHAYPQVYHQYTEIDCGKLAVTKYFGSCFDDNPYTELLIWLPYIGYRKLDPDEVVGKTLHVVYHCDCLTGDCVCFIETIQGGGYNVPFGRVIAQYSGNCGVRVPFGATSFDAAVAASVQLLGGAVGAIAGGAAGAIAGISGASIGASQIGNSISGSTVSAVNGSKIMTERSGTAGASSGYLSIQYPYLLRTVPNQSLPDNYMDLEGYPANLAGPLSKFSGFAAVETINLNGLSASQAEIDEIKRLLVGGVYI